MKVYGLFDCQASKGDIRKELLDIFDDFQVPESTRWFLKEVRELKTSSNLASFLRENEAFDMPPQGLTPTKLIDLNYVIEFPDPVKSPEYTIRLMDDILSQLYMSSLYNKGDPFRGGVVSENNGKIVLKDQ